MKHPMLAIVIAIAVMASGAAAGYSQGFGPTPPQEPVGMGKIDDMLGFTQQLAALMQDGSLTENERALLVVEKASRQQVAQLGLSWTDDVYVPEHALPGDAIRALAEHLGGVVGPEQEAALEAFDALPEPVRDALAKTVNAFHALDLAAKNVYTEADLEHLEALAKQHGDELPEEAWLEQVGERIAGIFSARLALVEAAFELKEALEEEGEGLEVPSLMVPMGHQDEDMDDVEYDDDGICINCHGGDNIYEDDYVLLIDTSLNTDKKYYNNAGGHHTAESVDSGASALIDFGGNNKYGNPDSLRGDGVNGGALTSGGAMAAVGSLLSLGTGNGVFTGGDKGVNGGAADLVGCCSTAMGFLMNLAGDDEYRAGGEGVNGGGESGNDFAYVSGLLIDFNGTDYYRDQMIPEPGELGDEYYCIGNMTGNCGFTKEDDGTNSCVDCSVIPKEDGSTGVGAQIDVGVPEEVLLPDPEEAIESLGNIVNEQSESLENIVNEQRESLENTVNEESESLENTVNEESESLENTVESAIGKFDAPQTCDPSECKRFWFRINVAEVGDGLLSEQPPEGNVSVVHSGSDALGRRVVLVSEPLVGGLVIGDGDSATSNEMILRVALAAWTNALDGGQFHVELNAVGESDVLPLGARSGGLPNGEGNMTPHERTITLPLGNVDGAPVGPAGDLNVPEGYALQFSFSVVSVNILQQQGLGYSMFYDSEIHPSHIDLPVVPPFEPTSIRILDENDDEVPQDQEFTAGEPMELFAGGYNETDEFVMNVRVDWAVDESERGTLSSGAGSEVTFTPMKAGKGNLTISRDGVDEYTLEFEVVPGDVSRLEIRDAPGGDGEVAFGPFTAGEPVTFYAAGYDAGNNFIENREATWSVMPQDRGVFSTPDAQDGSVTFTPEKEGGGTITASSSGLEPGELNIVVNPGALESLRVEMMDSEGDRQEVKGGFGSFQAGTQLHLFAVGYDAGGNRLEDEWGADWEVTEDLGDFAPPSENDGNVTFTAHTAGTGDIGATLGDATSDPVGIEITPGEPSQVNVAQAPNMVVNETSSLTIQLQDAFGNVVEDGGSLAAFEGTNLTFALESDEGELDAQEAELGGDGETVVEIVYCCTAGLITIRVNATDGDGNDVLNGKVFQVTVEPGDLDHVLIQDMTGSARDRQGPFTIEVGQELGLHASGYDAFDNHVGAVEADWVIEDWDGEGAPNIGSQTESASIIFVSDSPGEATIRALVDDVTDMEALVTVTPGDLESIWIETKNENGERIPAAQDLLQDLHGGQSVELFAAGYDAFDNYRGDFPVTWELDPGEERGSLSVIANEQSPTVRFTAGKIGTGYVNVTGPVDVQNGVIEVNVTHPGPPGELVFATQPMNATAGEPWDSVTVHVEDGFGNHVLDDDVTEVTLRLGDGFQGSLQGPQLTQTVTDGLVTFQEVRHTVADAIWIVAETNNIGSQPVDVAQGPFHVTPADLDSIRVQDAPGDNHGMTATQFEAGETVALFASGYDTYDNHRGEVAVQWNVHPGPRGTFNANDTSATHFTPQKAGTGTIEAVHPDTGIKHAFPFTVGPGPLQQVKVHNAPDAQSDPMESIQLSTGQQISLYAAGYDAHNNYVGQDVPVTWRIDPEWLGKLDATQASINTTLTALQGGTGRIIADHEELQGDLEIAFTVSEDPIPPQAVIQAACNALTCTLDASGSKPGTATIASYTWDLGDGNTQQGKNIEHTYAEPGEYTLALNVSDGNGLSHETQHTVTVTLPPEPMIALEVTTRPQDPAPGEAVTATARIENVGNVALLQFSVAFTLDDEPLREQSYPRLEAGENMTIRATWSASEGNQTLIVEVPGHATQSQKIQVATTDTLPDGAPPGITAQEAPAAPLIIVLLVVFAVPWILKRRQPTREAKTDATPRKSPRMSRKTATVLIVALFAGLAMAGCVDGLDLEPGTPQEPRFTISLEAQPAQGGVQVNWDATPLEGSSLARVEVQAVKPAAPGEDSEPIRHDWNQTGPPAAGSHVIALPPGQWHLAARAEDDTGREAWSQDRIVTLSQPRFSGLDAQSAGQAEPLRINAGQDKVIHDAQGKGEASFTLNGETQPGPGQRVLGHEWRYDDGAGVRQAVLATFTRPIGEHVFTFHVEYEDAQGIKGVAEDTVRVQVLPNRAPVADAGPSREARDAGGSGGAQVVLDGSGSFDPDGRIVSYSWESDGSVVLSQREGVVRFPVGTHSVTLTVRDNAGATGQDTTRVIVHPGHHPVARGVASDGIDLDGDGTGAVELDGSGSFHPDGTITRYVWNDAGGNVVGEQAVVTLAVDVGTHEFTLVVEDEAGRTGTDSVMVTVLPQPDPPQAHFQANCSGLTCTFDASGSTGYELAYDWDFGDGSTASGEMVMHDYAEAATYSVTLVVRDASGRTASLQEGINLRPDHPLRISSPAFGAGDEIPGRYGCQLLVNWYLVSPNALLNVEFGVSPPLVLTAPSDAQTLAFTVLDVTGGEGPESFPHWIAYDIEIPLEGIVEIAPGTPPPGTQGMNWRNSLGFTEFCSFFLPGLTDSSSTYEFRVYALDTTLDLEVGATHQEFQEAIQGHVLATNSFEAIYTDKLCAAGVSPDDCVMF